MLQTCPFPSPDPPRLLLLSPPLQRWMGTRTPRSSKPYGLPQWTVRLVREHLADVTALHPPPLVTLEHGDKGDGVKRRGWVGLAEGLGQVFAGHPTMWRPLLHDHPYVHTNAHPPVPAADLVREAIEPHQNRVHVHFIFRSHLFLFQLLTPQLLLHFALLQPNTLTFQSSVILFLCSTIYLWLYDYNSNPFLLSWYNADNLNPFS